MEREEEKERRRSLHAHNLYRYPPGPSSSLPKKEPTHSKTESRKTTLALSFCGRMCGPGWGWVERGVGGQSAGGGKEGGGFA